MKLQGGMTFTAVTTSKELRKQRLTESLKNDPHNQADVPLSFMEPFLKITQQIIKDGWFEDETFKQQPFRYILVIGSPQDTELQNFLAKARTYYPNRYSSETEKGTDLGKEKEVKGYEALRMQFKWLLGLKDEYELNAATYLNFLRGCHLKEGCIDHVFLYTAEKPMPPPDTEVAVAVTTESVRAYNAEKEVQRTAHFKAMNDRDTIIESLLTNTSVTIYDRLWKPAYTLSKIHIKDATQVATLTAEAYKVYLVTGSTPELMNVLYANAYFVSTIDRVFKKILCKEWNPPTPKFFGVKPAVCNGDTVLYLYKYSDIPNIPKGGKVKRVVKWVRTAQKVQITKGRGKNAMTTLKTVYRNSKTGELRVKKMVMRKGVRKAVYVTF